MNPPEMRNLSGRRFQMIGAALAFLTLNACASFAWAQSDFEKGNAAYEAGRFSDAAQAYQKSILEGVSGANVYFNLGNAHLRAGEKGRAVLNYQRALALRPGHPEAAANLAFVQRSLKLTIGPATGWSQFVEWLGVDAMAVIAALGAWVAVAGAVVLLGPWRRRPLGWSLVVVGAIPLLAGVLLLFELRGGARDPERAIVVSDAGTKAHYAPADNSREVQVLPAGTEIRLLQDRGNWVYVEVAGGLRGWVSAEAVDTVVPRAPGLRGS